MAATTDSRIIGAVCAGCCGMMTSRMRSNAASMRQLPAVCRRLARVCCATRSSSRGRPLRCVQMTSRTCVLSAFPTSTFCISRKSRPTTPTSTESPTGWVSSWKLPDSLPTVSGAGRTSPGEESPSARATAHRDYQETQRDFVPAPARSRNLQIIPAIGARSCTHGPGSPRAAVTRRIKLA